MTRLYLAPSTRTSFFQVRNSHRTNLSGSHLGEPLKPGRPKRPDIHSPHALAARVWAHDFNLDNRILPGPLILQWRREKSHWALAAVTSEPMGRRGSGLVAADSHAVLATAGVSPASCSVQQWLSSVPTDHRQLEGLVFGSCLLFWAVCCCLSRNDGSNSLFFHFLFASISQSVSVACYWEKWIADLVTLQSCCEIWLSISSEIAWEMISRDLISCSEYLLRTLGR